MCPWRTHLTSLGGRSPLVKYRILRPSSPFCPDHPVKSGAPSPAPFHFCPMSQAVCPPGLSCFTSATSHPRLPAPEWSRALWDFLFENQDSSKQTGTRCPELSKVVFSVHRVPSPDQMASSLSRESSCLLLTVSAMGWAGGYGQGGK